MRFGSFTGTVQTDTFLDKHQRPKNSPLLCSLSNVTAKSMLVKASAAKYCYQLLDVILPEPTIFLRP